MSQLVGQNLSTYIISRIRLTFWIENDWDAIYRNVLLIKLVFIP